MTGWFPWCRSGGLWPAFRRSLAGISETRSEHVGFGEKWSDSETIMAPKAGSATRCPWSTWQLARNMACSFASVALVSAQSSDVTSMHLFKQRTFIR